MKILVISLLRLGDILMMAPVILKLRQKYPDAQIDLLINEPFKHVKPLMPEVNEWLYFDREGLQNLLGSADSSFFEAHDRVQALVNELSKKSYDVVFNFTHNRVAGWLTGLISAKDRRGLSLSGDGQAIFGSSWFRYLNDFVALGGKNVFHYNDVFAFGAGLGPVCAQWQWHETEAGREEARQLAAPHKEYILIQPFASDAKKEWETSSWLQALHDFKIFHPQLDVLFLASRQERDRAEEFKATAESAGVAVHAVCCGLEAALSLIARAKLLMTVDTSIKHLAAGTATPVIELCLGSSDWRKTGIYKDNAYIVHSRENCWPCPHARPCQHYAHACGQKLNPQAVSLVANHVISSRERDLVLVAREFRSEVEILKTHLSAKGLWMALPTKKGAGTQFVKDWIDQSSWKFLLESEHNQLVASYGTETMRFCESLAQEFPAIEKKEWTEQLRTLEDEFTKDEYRASRLTEKLRREIVALKNPAALRLFLSDVQDFSKSAIGHPHLAVTSQVLQRRPGHQAGEIDFALIRKVQSLLADCQKRSQIRLKLARVLKNQLMEAL